MIMTGVTWPSETFVILTEKKKRFILSCKKNQTIEMMWQYVILSNVESNHFDEKNIDRADFALGRRDWQAVKWKIISS